jgi:hypothetical protein
MTQSPHKKSHNLLKTVLWAVPTIGIYTALFANQTTVMKYFTKGSYYAALPILTAIIVSFVHGAFASQCLETLGISARKSTAPSPSIKKQKQPVVKKDQRARLTVN